MHLDLMVIAYGFGERRVEIAMRPAIPPAIVDDAVNELTRWSHSQSFIYGKDVKHNERWACYACGQPAHETQFNAVSWLHLPQPKLTMYVHFACEAGGGPCHNIINDATAILRVAQSGVMEPPPNLPMPRGVSAFPVAGSCAKCLRDETAKPEFPLSRCGKCKLTRYCSINCQKEDWGRHKLICKTIKSVKWNW